MNNRLTAAAGSRVHCCIAFLCFLNCPHK